MSKVFSLRCHVCNEPIDVKTAKTDGNGKAVHEKCYLFTLGITEAKKPQGKESGK
jgi:hypothetical protein